MSFHVLDYEDIKRYNRMEAALRCIQQWDCLNPTPRTDLCGDLAWLKTLVNDALELNTKL